MSDTSITRREHANTWREKTTEAHVFRLQPFRGFVLEVEDIHFHHDSAVFLPNYAAEEQSAPQAQADPSMGLGVVAEALLLAKRPATANRKILILGHADTSGADAYNIGISIKRANAVRHVILGERAPFVQICQQQHKTEDIQLILQWVTQIYGWDTHPGPVNNVMNAQTRAAIKKFQQRYNVEWEAAIAEDGSLGPQTWGAVFDVYQDMVQNMTETDDAGLAELRTNFASKFLPPNLAGCGEHFPIEAPRRNNFRSRINRRVEILYFPPGQEPRMDCHPGGSACTPLLCEVYNPLMYSYTHLPVPPSLPRGNRVFLKLTYLDPEGNEKLFPRDFPVKIKLADNSTFDATVSDDGMLRFAAPRRAGHFTLTFETPALVYVATGPEGSDDVATHRLGAAADLDALHTANMRFFSTPKSWSISISDWAVDPTPFYRPTPDYHFLVPGRFGRTVGSNAAPVKMQLDPHWTFARFEFFDRTFGHTGHNHKRINIPVTLIDAWRQAAGVGDPDIRSHWTIKDSDVTLSVHAIPWIIQRKPDDSAELKPDPTCQLEFSTAANTYVVSASATARTVEAVTAAARLNPGVDRLKLYDLPQKWRSKKYFTRFTDNTGDLWENITQARLDDSKADDKPLIFSLDDMVLVDAAMSVITLAATEDPLIFFHQFKSPGAGVSVGNHPVSDNGIYNPGADRTKTYYPYSDIVMSDRSHITDYPNWTRLVAAQANLFDVFNVRTPDGDRVVGARAAVRWIDATAAANFVAPNTTMPNRPARQDFPAANGFFSIQPMFDQKRDFMREQARPQGAYPEFSSPRALAASFDSWQTGRFDMVLLRDCDVRNGKEVLVNFHYLRFAMNFAAMAAGFNQQNYRHNMLTNVANRWNGKEAFGQPVCQFTPETAGVPMEGDFYWHVQDVPQPRAHYLISVVNINRAFMNASQGLGSFGPNNDQASATNDFDGNNHPGWFTAAHECGHGDSLLDEYNERWGCCSYYNRSVAEWIPGEPYEWLDADPSMMNHNQQIRPRYFWHNAEWVRGAVSQNFVVEYSGRKYKLPRHTMVAPRLRTYLTWPFWSDNRISGGISPGNLGSRRSYDLYLHPVGDEPFARDMVPGQDFRGQLMIDVWIFVTFDDAAVVHSTIEQTLQECRAAVFARFNRQFVVTGGTTVGGNNFNPCLVHFTPRFLVQTWPSTFAPAAEKRNSANYFDSIGLQQAPAGGGAPVAVQVPAAEPARTNFLRNTAPGLYTAEVTRLRGFFPEHFILHVSTTYANSWVGGNEMRLRDSATRGPDFVNFFGDMVGLDMTQAALAPNVLKGRIEQRIVRRAFINGPLA